MAYDRGVEPPRGTVVSWVLLAAVIAGGCSSSSDADPPRSDPAPIPAPIPPRPEEPPPVASTGQTPLPDPDAAPPPRTPLPAGLKSLVFGMTLAQVKDTVGNKLAPIAPTFAPDPGVPYAAHSLQDSERNAAWDFLWHQARKMTTPLPGTWRQLATDIGGYPASCVLGFIEGDALSAIQCRLTGEQGPRALFDALGEVLIARHGRAVDIPGGRHWANDSVLLELRLDGAGNDLAVVLDNRSLAHNVRITEFRVAHQKALDDRFVTWLGAQADQLRRERERVHEQRKKLERDLSPPPENPIE